VTPSSTTWRYPSPEHRTPRYFRPPMRRTADSTLSRVYAPQHALVTAAQRAYYHPRSEYPRARVSAHGNIYATTPDHVASPSAARDPAGARSLRPVAAPGPPHIGGPHSRSSVIVAARPNKQRRARAAPQSAPASTHRKTHSSWTGSRQLRTSRPLSRAIDVAARHQCSHSRLSPLTRTAADGLGYRPAPATSI
jgi:hypothetical protein